MIDAFENLSRHQKQVVQREAVCRCRDSKEYRDLESILDTTQDNNMVHVADQCMYNRRMAMIEEILDDRDFMENLCVHPEDLYGTRGNANAR